MHDMLFDVCRFDLFVQKKNSWIVLKIYILQLAFEKIGTSDIKKLSIIDSNFKTQLMFQGNSCF